MTEHADAERPELHLHPPAPKDFDPFDASAAALARHGLPRRPDRETEPGLAELWEKKATQYRAFEHLAPVATPSSVKPAALGPDAVDSCGYSLATSSGPFTSLFITWTVPDMRFDGDPFGINTIHTFAGLGFLDVHTTLSVNAAQTVTATLSATGAANVGLPVRPGDTLSASLCLNTNAAGTAAYFFTNETTAQTMSFSFDSHFPPAQTVDAGVTRDGVIRPGQSLARFGTVYFDEVSAYNTTGHQSLLSGQAINMTDTNGTVLANAYGLTDYAFKVVHA